MNPLPPLFIYLFFSNITANACTKSIQNEFETITNLSSHVPAIPLDPQDEQTRFSQGAAVDSQLLNWWSAQRQKCTRVSAVTANPEKSINGVSSGFKYFDGGYQPTGLPLANGKPETIEFTRVAERTQIQFYLGGAEVSESHHTTASPVGLKFERNLYYRIEQPMGGDSIKAAKNSGLVHQCKIVSPDPVVHTQRLLCEVRMRCEGAEVDPLGLGRKLLATINCEQFPSGTIVAYVGYHCPAPLSM